MIEELILSIVVTAFAYLLVPMIFFISCDELKKSTINKIVIINGICICLIFSLINLSNGDKANVLPAFLWSSIAHWILKTRAIEEIEHQPKFDTTPTGFKSKSPQKENEQKTFSLSFENEVPKTHNGNLTYGSDIALEQSTSETTNLQFCQKCGRQLLTNSRFCNGCGTPVTEKYTPKFQSSSVSTVKTTEPMPEPEFEQPLNQKETPKAEEVKTELSLEEKFNNLSEQEKNELLKMVLDKLNKD